MLAYILAEKTTMDITTPRIATFDEWVPFHIGTDIIEPATDDPIDWSEFMRAPRFEKVYDNGKKRTYRRQGNKRDPSLIKV